MIYSSWDIEQNILKLVILGHFFPFHSLKTRKIKILKKWTNLLEISFYTCVPKIKIIWCMVPEIWSATDRTFCHYEPFFTLLLLIWYMVFQIWSATDKFFVILDRFLPFCPPINPQNQNFEKLKKNPGAIIISHNCPKNHDHMLYCSLDMACNGFNCCFHFGLFFTLLPP